MVADDARRAAFDRVDATGDPADFVRYLDATRSTAFFREIKARTLALLAPPAGGRILDVGCGTGDDVLALARLVGSAGEAVGADFSITMLVEARRRAEERGLSARFARADAAHLPFATDTFDGCRHERLLQHVPDPAAVLGELVRVARPGGRIVGWEADLEMLAFDAPDNGVSRRMVHAICDSFRQGAIGHQLYRRYRALGLLEVETEPLSRAITDLALMESAFNLRATARQAARDGVVTAAEAADWLAALETAAAGGLLLRGLGFPGQRAKTVAGKGAWA